MNPETWTVRRLLEWTTGHFRERKIETPRLEAEILLAHSLGCKRIELYVRSEEEVADSVRATFRGLIKRRGEGCPNAYLVGKREFFSLAFPVGPGVLIPRPETEWLVTEALIALKPLEKPTVLDLGTGSGCIAISIAVRQPTATVDAVDASSSALDYAKKTAVQHAVANRVHFYEGSWYAPLDETKKYDVIASNPPYITQADYLTLEPTVRDFEPESALVAGVDGLDAYRAIIPTSMNRLTPTGMLILEIGRGQDAEVGALMESAGFRVRKVKDGAGIFRVLVGTH